MITRTSLRILTFAFPLLLVTFAALMATMALFHAIGDEQVSQVLARCGVGAGVAVLINLLLLVGTLALRAVQEDEAR